MSISSSVGSTGPAQSFNNWLVHFRKLSSQSQGQLQDLQDSFSQVVNGNQTWGFFEKKVHEIIGPDEKLKNRIHKEAKNAYTFPQISTFFSWLHGNRHLAPERKKIIAKVVRNALFEATRFSHPSAEKICRNIGDELKKITKFGKGWEGNISHVVHEIKRVVGQAASPVPGKGSSFVDKHALAEIFKQTQHASLHGYKAPSGAFVRIDPKSTEEMQRSTHLFQECPRLGGMKRAFDTEFSVVNKDSLRAAKDFVDRGEKPLVLNLANAQSPGGGVIGGSKAQEEDLMRCTNYSYALFPDLNRTLAGQLKGKYRIPETGAIVTQRVSVIRDGSKNYAFLEHPFEVSMLASAAYNLKSGHWGGPKGTRTKEGKISKSQYDFETGTKMKIRTQLAIAAQEGYTCLVLGAFGCGAFANKPEDIAKWYKEFLDGEFRGVFKHVTFAVLGGAGPAEHNVDVFSSFFESKKRSRAEDEYSQSVAPAAAPQYEPQDAPSASTGDVAVLKSEIEGLQQTLERLLEQGSQDEGMISALIEASDRKRAQLRSLLGDDEILSKRQNR
jgi:uncharacterized protein (TIGR02452 family)